jgi:hypothetical protein
MSAFPAACYEKSVLRKKNLRVVALQSRARRDLATRSADPFNWRGWIAKFVRLTGERKNYLTTDPNRELFTVRLLFTGTFAYVSNANGASC